MNNQKNVSLYCEDLFSFSGGWTAWVEFRVTRYGFSIWVGGEDGMNGKVNKRASAVKKPYSWRTAAQELLKLEEGGIFGDFRENIQVIGEEGWQAEILTLCWMQEDEIDRSVKEFLVGLNESNLEILAIDLGSFLTDTSLSLLSRCVDVDCLDPKVLWEKLFSDTADFSLEMLVNRLEQEHEENIRAAAASRNAKLAPFKESIDKIMSESFNFFGNPNSWAENILVGFRTRNLRAYVERMALEFGRIPTEDEVQMACSEIKKMPVTLTANLGRL